MKYLPMLIAVGVLLSCGVIDPAAATEPQVYGNVFIDSLDPGESVSITPIEDDDWVTTTLTCTPSLSDITVNIASHQPNMIRLVTGDSVVTISWEGDKQRALEVLREWVKDEVPMGFDREGEPRQGRTTG